MTISFSPGIINKMLGATGGNTFASLMTGGRLFMYSGPRPASATGTEVLSTKIFQSAMQNSSLSASGLKFCLAASILGGSISKSASVWKNAAGSLYYAGIATWFRFYDSNTTTGIITNETACRFDGDVGTTSDFDMQIATTSFVKTDVLYIDSFKIKFPFNM